MRALRMRVAAQFPERSHDLTFLRHSALAQMFEDAGHDETHADEAFEVFFTARNRVQLFDDVEASLRAPALALSLVRLEQRQRGSRSAAESRIYSTGTSPPLRRGPPNPTRAFSRDCSTFAGVEAAQRAACRR